MAENTAQERTEEATPKRKQDVRKKGEVPRSKDLSTFVSLMAAGLGMLLFGGELIGQISDFMRQGLTVNHTAAFSGQQIGMSLRAAVFDMVALLAPLLVIVFLAISASSFALGGWIFKLSLAAPKWERLNLIKGLGRMLSLKSLMELLKTIAKFLLVSVVVFLALSLIVGDLLQLPSLPIHRALSSAATTALWCFFAYTLALVFIVLMDVPFQVAQYQQKIKMTRQELKDEFKETEGRPEVKAAVREKQRSIAQMRMLNDVPNADVVITNPTHYAVALRYDLEGSGAPIVIAKGRNLIAARIREVAAEHDIELFSAPPLARALFASTEVGQQIPAKLFVAVAQVLAYVFQLKEAAKTRGAKVQRPKELPVPDEFLQHEFAEGDE